MRGEKRSEERRTERGVAVPSDLSSSRAKLVYLACVTAPNRTPVDLREWLGMPILALYPVLEELVERGHLERDGERYRPVETDSRAMGPERVSIPW